MKLELNKNRFTLYLLPIEKADLEAKPKSLLTLMIKNLKRIIENSSYLYRIFSHEKLDVVKIENIFAGFPAFIAGALTRTPYILWVAGPELEVIRILHPHLKTMHSISSLALRILSHIIVPRAKIVINISPMSEKIILKAFPRVYINLNSNYVDTQIFHPDQCFKEKNKKVLLYVGRLEEEKGISLMLNAIEQMSSKRNDFEVWIIGYGSLEKEITKKIEKKLLPIKLLGQKDLRELPFFYNCADIFLCPGLTEGPSAALMEALSCGLAVISTTGPIEHLQNGILVQRDGTAIAEAINFLLEHEDLRRKIANNALKLAESLNKSYMETMHRAYLFSARKRSASRRPTK